MSRETKEIKIDLDNLRARKIHSQKYDSNHHFYIEHYANQIKKLIKSRIKELEENSKYQDYFEFKMHDSILIYGTRGNGKTTIMINLKEIIQDEIEENKPKSENLVKNIKILEIIDPTLLEEEEDFLLVILKNLYTEVIKDYDSTQFNSDNKDFEKQLEKILEQIEGTRIIEKRIEIFDRFYGNKSGVSLAKAIHKLFYKATKIFGVKTIIVPIDDIDMNMVQGYKISETIRKYLASPYVIPIVSFNLKQMNAIIRKNKHKAFGLELINNDVEKYKDLDFLLSLPSDYLTAIFPPNRRIYLNSMYDILKKEEEEGNIIYLTSEKLKNNFKSFFSRAEVKVIDILSIFLEVVYEKRLSSDLVGDKLDDYLSNRSIRDFLHDLSSLINSFEMNEDTLTVNTDTLLPRFVPENQNLFINKEQALTSLWYDFLDLAKQHITKEDLKNNNIKNNWTNIITSVNYDDYAELVNKKTYRRLWLQNFYYRDDIKVIKNKENNEKTYSIQKKISISGFLELCLRSYIPMFLFQEIVARYKINYSIHDIMRLKEMAKADLFDVAYHISVMELFLKQHEYSNEELRKNAKVFASINVHYQKQELYDAKYNIPFLYKLRKQDLFFDDNNKDSNQIYFFSFFKSIAFFIDTLKIIEKSNLSNTYQELNEDEKKKIKIKLKKLAEQYRINLPCENSNDFVEGYVNRLMSKGYIDNLMQLATISLEDSELGIMESIKFSKRLIKFFYDIRANTNLEDNFSSLNFMINSWFGKKGNYRLVEDNEKIKGEGTLSKYFDFPLATYLSGFSQSLLISLIQTQKDIQSLDIFTINSIHGANLTLLKDYESNNIKKLSKESNAFISNINYLLKLLEKNEQQKYSILAKLDDKKEYKEDTDFNKKKVNNILNFYNNFLNIDFFNMYISKYELNDASENCDFKDEKDATKS